MQQEEMVGSEAFIKKFSDWLKGNAESLDDILATKGGWEGWIQVEFLRANSDLIQSYGYEAFREAHIYENKLLAVDWVFHKDNALDELVELKVESHGYTTDQFMNYVAGDMIKMRSRYLDDDWRECHRYVVVVSTSIEMAKLLYAERAVIDHNSEDKKNPDSIEIKGPTCHLCDESGLGVFCYKVTW